MLTEKEAHQRVKGLVKSKAQTQGKSLRKLSLAMGENRNYLSYHLGRNSLSPADLAKLSNLIRFNLLNFYAEIVDTTIRPHWNERNLMSQIAELKKKVSNLEAENEKLWSKIGSRK